MLGLCTGPAKALAPLWCRAAKGCALEGFSGASSLSSLCENISVLLPRGTPTEGVCCFSGPGVPVLTGLKYCVILGCSVCVPAL
jgi:hypothetical protein